MTHPYDSTCPCAACRHTSLALSIAGTRIGIEHVAGDIAAGQTIEQYAADKELTVEQVQEALDAALARAGEAVPRG